MKTKICSNLKCLQPQKLLSEFYSDKLHKDGLRSDCKDCVKEDRKNHYQKDKEKILRNMKKLHEKYPWKQIFQNIKNRCENSKNKSYKDYGERGIKCKIIEEEIKFLWFRDKAYDMKKPSIDRKDNDKNYELSNCEFIEMEINRIKDRFKSILQYDLNNIFIREFKSITYASKKLNCSITVISDALRQKQKTASGYKWKYKDEIES